MEKATILLALLPLLISAQTQNDCIPKCAPGDTPPNDGGPPCLCTFTATLPGCTINACEPGADATTTYTCQCTPENHQTQCVKLRCTNETHTPGASVTTQTGVEVGQPICDNECKCGKQPPDCTPTSKSPYKGHPPCSCSSVSWPTGCTLRPCQEGDTGDDDYFCECTDEYAPKFCLRPQCKHRFL